jgi:beta-barrel assembly-enhancing protease
MRVRGWLAAVCLAAALAPGHGRAAPDTPADATLRHEIDLAADDLEQRLLRCGCTYDHPGLDPYLQEIAERLLTTDTTPARGPVRVRAFRNPDANAFALPNGAIFITTGLLQQLDSEAQVASVLGHELTHYTRSHALEERRNAQHAGIWSRGIGLLLASTIAVLAHDPQAALLAANLSNTSADLWYLSSVSGYSQHLEREADSEGLRRMAAAGYDANEGIAAFEHLAAATKDDAKATPYFSSHPRLAERIASYRLLIGSEYSNAVGSERRVGRDEYAAHTQGLTLDQVEILLAARRADRAAELLTAELGRGETARGRYLEGEVATQRLHTADGENQALAAYERAIALPEPPADALRQAAMIHRRRGEHADAAREFQRYLDLAPNADDAPLVRAYLAGQAAPTNSPPAPGEAP